MDKKENKFINNSNNTRTTDNGVITTNTKDTITNTTTNNNDNNLNNNNGNSLKNTPQYLNNPLNSNFNTMRNFGGQNGFNMQPNKFNRFNNQKGFPKNIERNVDSDPVKPKAPKKNDNDLNFINNKQNTDQNNQSFDNDYQNPKPNGLKDFNNQNIPEEQSSRENQQMMEEPNENENLQNPNVNDIDNDFGMSNNPRQQNRNRNNLNNTPNNLLDKKLNRLKNNNKNQEDKKDNPQNSNEKDSKPKFPIGDNNMLQNIPSPKTPKTPTSANQDNKKNDNKSDKKPDNNKKPPMNGKMGAAANAAALKKQLKDGEEGAKEAVKNQVKEQAKQQVKKKVVEAIIKYIVPILPYIGIAILIILAVLFVIFVIISIFSSEDVVINEIELNYCENVNLKWGAAEDQNITISSDSYVAYQISMSEFANIDDPEVIKSLAIIYRTNLYSNANNQDSNVCNFEVDQEPTQSFSEDLLQLVKDTNNKVFTMSSEKVKELEIDENFSYRSISSNSKGEPMYVLSQDGLKYNKSWIDENVGSSHIVNANESLTFSPFAAWYLSIYSDENYHDLLYHFYDPAAKEGHIYRVKRVGSSEDWLGSSMCSDISLSSTSLEKEEFVDALQHYSNTNSSYGMKVFAANAEKIYDISIKNNFNPEMVVIRAMSEGFSPGGSTNNYWGLGCTNTGGRKACQSFSSLDDGIVGFINNIKGHNYATVHQMMLKYAYIGKYWYNPGSSSLGGCYYFKYIREYLDVDHAKVVENACAESNRCSGASCLETTSEDQNAYAQWQVSKMSANRQKVFNISADSCEEEEGEPEETGDLATLGARVAKYAVDTYDSWQYSQANRHQDGYVDCSSLVSRAYKHFNVKIYNSADSSSEIYRWCEQNAKTITGNLKAGDLIFYNTGSHYNSSHYKGIGHVEMYIGNNKRFGAHTHYKDDPSKDVSIKSYSGDGNLFCRPYKQ